MTETKNLLALFEDIDPAADAIEVGFFYPMGELTRTIAINKGASKPFCIQLKKVKQQMLFLFF